MSTAVVGSFSFATTRSLYLRSSGSADGNSVVTDDGVTYTITKLLTGATRTVARTSSLGAMARWSPGGPPAGFRFAFADNHRTYAFVTGTVASDVFLVSGAR